MVYYLQKEVVYMKIKNQVKLKPKEQEFLKRLVSKGSEKARKITRCRILLLADEGKTDPQIMGSLHVARNTVKTVRSRYLAAGLETAVNEQPRPGAPLKFSGRDKAKITAIACSKPPEGRNRWTLRLIADTMVELDMVDDISHHTVQRVLKKTNLSLT
jgi:transposase